MFGRSLPNSIGFGHVPGTGTQHKKNGTLPLTTTLLRLDDGILRYGRVERFTFLFFFLMARFWIRRCLAMGVMEYNAILGKEAIKMANDLSAEGFDEKLREYGLRNRKLRTKPDQQTLHIS